MKRLPLSGLDRSGAADGDVPTYDKATDRYVPAPPAAAGVETVTAGAYVQVDATDPAHIIVTAMVPMTTLNSSGLPEIVFDADGHLIYTEAP